MVVSIETFIINSLNRFGYIGILLLIMLENIFPPISSVVILCFGGYITTSTKLNVVGVIVVSTIGSILGSIILYFLGKILNKEKVTKIISGKIGKILRLKIKDIDKAIYWFDTKGSKTVFFCRFIPIVRSLISIPAGMSEMSFFKFIILTSIGTVIWNTVLTILGRIMGKNWFKVVNFIQKYATITLIILITLLIGGIIYFYLSRSKRRNK